MFSYKFCEIFNNVFSIKQFHGPTPPTSKFLPTRKFCRPTQPTWPTQIFDPRHPRNPRNLGDSEKYMPEEKRQYLVERDKESWEISRENTCVGVSFYWSCRSQVFNFIKKRLQHRCFPDKFAKCLRTPIL